MSSNSASKSSWFEKQFGLTANKTNVRTEVLAGITTFLTMSYILVVNPSIISDPLFIIGDEATGVMVANGVFIATCLASFFGTMLMALMANLPFALAPGMGLNATFAYTVMLDMGHSYAEALAIVFISGIIFVLISVFGLREVLVRAIPNNLKLAISGGIGLFIATIGLINAGIIVNNDATLISLANMSDFTSAATRGVYMTLLGLVIIAVFHVLKIKGGMILGILAAFLAGIPLGVTILPENFSLDITAQFGDFLNVSLGSFLSGLGTLFADKNLLEVAAQIFVVVLSFTLVDMLDTIGTLIGTATSAGMIDEKGEVKNMKQALLSDAIATVGGAMMGTSTVTTFIESGSGISEGGRTGLSSLTTAILFLPAMLLAPFITLIPNAATAPALIFVGVLMMSSLLKLDLSDITEAVPAFLVIIMMPLSYSIGNGVSFGIMFYVLLKLFTGKTKQLNKTIVILAFLLMARYLFM